MGSGALSTALENPRESFIFLSSRTQLGMANMWLFWEAEVFWDDRVFHTVFRDDSVFGRREHD